MRFDVPVAVFLFKRIDTLEKIFERIRNVKPQKVYLIADGPRNEEERSATDLCRKTAEDLVDWDCELVKIYAENNIGVIMNIGGGAQKVLEKEDYAIFLEDDNLPEVSFFSYCREMLIKYKHNDDVLWVCGTNYLGKYASQNSYMFTKHLLPCGWASWKHKFLRYYDMFLNELSNEKQLENFRQSYYSKALYKQQIYSVRQTKYFIENNFSRSSWDYQMLYSVRGNNKYGISPCNNLIKNIGVDLYSIHGGNTWKNEMTRRLCGMDSHPLEFPLKHPEKVCVDEEYEKKIEAILLSPYSGRIKRKMASVAKKILRMDPYASMAEFLRKKNIKV